MKYLIVFTAFIVSLPVLAESRSNESMHFSGDTRLGYFHKERTDRDSSKNGDNQWRLRVRAGLSKKINETFSLKLRFAGRYSTDQDGGEFVWDGTSPSSDGLKLGQSTFDEAYVKYKNNNWSLKLGRIQTKFELKGVARKSLDRNESPNTDINWTDGAHISYAGKHEWKTHVILQRNLRSSPTNVRRKPLNFSDSGSRISYLLAFENNAQSGNVVQRGFNISYLPKSLQKDGSSTGRIKDYWGFTAKSALSWRVGTNKMRFMLASEIGYAPETPTNQSLKIDGNDDSSGWATQITANFINFFPKHSVGLVYGYVGAGWLLAPDFRNNNTSIEGRYKWQLNKTLKIEGRLRQRKDLNQLTSTQQTRDDVDYYFRVTYKF